MKRKIVIAVVLVVVVIAGLAAVKVFQIKKLMAAGAAFVPPPESVSSAVAHEEKWQGFISSIATIAARAGHAGATLRHIRSPSTGSARCTPCVHPAQAAGVPSL